jgi:hypothetical protein
MDVAQTKTRSIGGRETKPTYIHKGKGIKRHAKAAKAMSKKLMLSMNAAINECRQSTANHSMAHGRTDHVLPG